MKTFFTFFFLIVGIFFILWGTVELYSAINPYVDLKWSQLHGGQKPLALLYNFLYIGVIYVVVTLWYKLIIFIFNPY